MSLDGLSLSALLNELDSTLRGGRIERIFQPDVQTLVLFIRIPGQTVRLVISSDPRQPRMYLASGSFENPETPPTFCMLLRKHLEDGRIGSIVQHSLDRIALLSIDIREDGGVIVTKYLVVELMGKHSNIILTQNDTIIDSIRRVGPNMSRHRQVLPGKPYLLPPGQNRVNLLQIPTKNFIDLLKDQTGQIEKLIIGSAIGIGPLSAKEILWRADISPKMSPESLSEQDWRHFEIAIGSVIEQAANSRPTPQVRIDQTNRILGFAAFPLQHLTSGSVFDFQTMSKAVEFISSLVPQAIPEKDHLYKLVGSLLDRLKRKKEILTLELAEANSADDLRRRADILMTFLPSIRSGQEIVILPDILSEQPDASPLSIELNPRETVLQNAQAYYARYNKQKRAQQSIELQLTQLIEEAQYLEGVQVMLDQSSSTKEIREIEQELISGEYIVQKNSKKKTEPVSVPLSFILPDGSSVTVGKNNRQNDFVTFKYARPDDIWFHTKDIPGSHVILRPTGTADQALLTAAARIAAYFSKARQSSNVPVDYTIRRYVKKPSGAKPGFVIYDRQSTLFVTPDETEITAYKKGKK